MITESMPIASMVSTVSRSDSFFFSDDEAAEKESTSADIRLAAVSKDIRVRVDSSKKRVATVRPRRVGTFGLVRRADLGEGVGHPQHLADLLARPGPRC